MATNAKNTEKTSKGEHVDPEQKIETALDKTELFFQKYTKQLLTGLLVVVVLVGGFFAYEYLVKRPRAVKAAEMMFVAEQLYAAEDYAAALEGDGSNAGFLDVVADYGSTRPGRLAAHYAGVCYMKLGQFDAASEYLAKYKSVKGAPGAIINAQNLGLRGDISVERGDYQQAEMLYARAAKAADNVLSTPYYLRKLAFVYAELGRTQEAINVCERIKSEYASSLEARDIDKLIGEFGQRR